ncbi:MAG: FecR family protein, partial [Lentisphaeraceae bacterium]|nr:FecR family protein [Lentisphaeraceae bacterium]
MSKHELYNKYLNDSLSEAEEEELIKILNDDEKSQSFTNYIVETNMMVSAAENCELLDRQVSKSTLRIFTAIAAAFVLVFLIFKPNSTSFEVVSSDFRTYKKGTYIDTDSIIVDEGLLTIKHSNGSVFELKGPALLNINSELSMKLSKGSMLTTLSAEVDSFILNIPHGQIKDLGTSFGTVVKGQRTDVHVFSGKVEVRSKTEVEKLVKGESVSLSSKGQLQEIDFKEDIFDSEEADVVFMGNRELHPGEQMGLYLDKAGETLTGKVSLSFDKQKNLRYKILAYSKSKTVYESKVYKADDKYALNIPTKDSQDLIIEMKVMSGNVTNGILKVNDLSLITEGSRPYEGDVLIQSHSEWRYHFKGQPAQEWKTREFDDSNWLKGESSIGYGDEDLRTIIGGNELRKSVYNIYLRHQFDIGDLEVNSLKNLKAHLLADDGAILFINGKEALRYNLPEGPLNEETRALKTFTRNNGEMIYSNFSIPAKMLTSGENTVSVILFQRS